MNIQALIGKRFWSAKFFEHDLSKALGKNAQLKDVVFGRISGKIYFNFDIEDGSIGAEVVTEQDQSERVFVVEKITVYDKQTLQVLKVEGGEQ